MIFHTPFQDWVGAEIFSIFSSRCLRTLLKFPHTGLIVLGKRRWINAGPGPEALWDFGLWGAMSIAIPFPCWMLKGNSKEHNTLVLQTYSIWLCKLQHPSNLWPDGVLRVGNARGCFKRVVKSISLQGICNTFGFQTSWGSLSMMLQRLSSIQQNPKMQHICSVRLGAICLQKCCWFQGAWEDGMIESFETYDVMFGGGKPVNGSGWSIFMTTSLVGVEAAWAQCVFRYGWRFHSCLTSTS